jgi:hypothetical protein
MKLLGAAIFAATLTSYAGTAGAGTISIGLQEAGYFGGATTTVNTGSSSAGVVGYNYGTFSLNNVSALGSTAPGSLFSNAINATTSSAGALTIYLTQQGVTAPIKESNFLSSFTANLIPTGWTVKESTYFSSTNALYSGTLLATTLFTHASTSVNFITPALVGNGPYSLTEIYTISATAGGGTTNNTIDLTPVPEPSTLGLLGMGLLGIGLVRRRLLAKKV